ncbi:MAG: histidine kinase, partial [Elusimicrobia bacterium]|nr:histidine kinase [Elusimicrobiota bacterium]
GLRLAAKVRADVYDMPILVQSSSNAYAEAAHKAGARFLNKTSKSMLNDLRTFMHDNFGFGDFVFKMPDGTAVDRAHDLHSLVAALRRAPDESVAYHASRNHFSKWLMARTEFEAAYHIKPRTLSEFKNSSELKNYLSQALQGFISKMQRGVIVEFTPEYFEPDIPYAKIGTGSIGGKARGLAFFNSLLAKEDFSRHFDDVKITIPPLAVLATDFFDEFMDSNSLYALVHGNPEDGTITEAFLEAQLPQRMQELLRVYAERADFPLVVRSSSVMEDSQFQPFAGIYETYLLANSHSNFNVRLDQLCRAVKMVYASTFWGQARAYMGATSNLLDEEKMAVILQRLVGQRHGNRFYPSFSGVAQSHNFYPVPPAKAGDGTVHVALGLGLTVVEGRRSLRFCPKHPRRLPQFAKMRDYFDSTQQEFMALDAANLDFRPADDSLANILVCKLDQAMEDGTLGPMVSTYDPENDRLIEGAIPGKGAHVADFAPILQSNYFPLADITSLLLDVGRQAMGCEVEMEFAVDLEQREFNILQIRPMSALHASANVDMSGFAAEQVLCRTDKALGHGYMDDLSDIIYVKPGAFDTSATRAIAAEIAALNKQLSSQRRKYALIGPGRWGSGDQFLGIPVNWGQISNARLIVEVTLPDFMPDPSYGSHFLHNVISLGIGYFLINHLRDEGSMDWAWLDAQPAVSESAYLRHVRLPKPLDVRIDSRTGLGAALKS